MSSRQLITQATGQCTANSFIDFSFKTSFFTKTLWGEVALLPPLPHCRDHPLEKVILAHGPHRKDVLHEDPEFGPSMSNSHNQWIFYIWSSSSSIWYNIMCNVISTHVVLFNVCLLRFEKFWANWIHDPRHFSPRRKSAARLALSRNLGLSFSAKKHRSTSQRQGQVDHEAHRLAAMLAMAAFQPHMVVVSCMWKMLQVTSRRQK